MGGLTGSRWSADFSGGRQLSVGWDLQWGTGPHGVIVSFALKERWDASSRESDTSYVARRERVNESCLECSRSGREPGWTVLSPRRLASVRRSWRQTLKTPFFFWFALHHVFFCTSSRPPGGKDGPEKAMALG